MGKATIKFHYDAFGELRSDPAMDRELRDQAYAIASRANSLAGIADGYRVHPAPSKSRARYIVSADSEEARRLEATRRCLTRALTGG
ncbi:MAG: hypothetical protein LKI34_02840 [Bifidobacterium tibiigranuli]|jgi:hypothetical protein|uniref:hypothetical protein n=1 Tax=Bifidobacterium tibiigranuli TaxID=2172043 RepID=UPI0026EEB0CA|nr:hypothetical protein [Bifidobacterium tibiigranuli]MCI1673143.1 hypothetical protein [Bifidobacterium tibiigranuli]MCI1713612.1 hypothetical protein [Bifidobacterium tibiigranuli]